MQVFEGKIRINVVSEVPLLTDLNQIKKTVSGPKLIGTDVSVTH